MARSEKTSGVQKEPYPFMYFTSVNRRVEPYIMKDDELWDSVNFWTYLKVGGKSVRPGLTPFLNQVDSDAVKGLFYVKFPSGNVRLARLSGGKIYAVDPNSAANWGTADHTLASSGVFNSPEYAILTGTAHIVDKLSSTDYRYLEWTNSAGTDTITQRSTTSGTDPVVPYNAKTVVQFHRRIYAGHVYDGTNEFKSMLSWSSIDYVNKGNPSSPWTTETSLVDTTKASSRNVDRDYKGNILKITNINDRLNVYKDEGIYRYNEVQLFEIFGLSPIEGSIATLEETKQDIFFTNEGFFKTDGKESIPIGNGWYEVIKEILHNGIDPTKIHSFAANFLYFCYLGDITYDGKTLANACFVYNAFYDELSLWSFAKDLTTFGYFVDTNKEKIIVCGDDDGYTYKLDFWADSDAGDPIHSYFITKSFHYDSPYLNNTIAEIHGFISKGSVIEILADTDFSDKWKSVLTIGKDTSASRIDTSVLGYFKTVRFKFLWNGVGKRPDVYGIIPIVDQTAERNLDGKK